MTGSRRVAVTGLGVVSPVGTGAEIFFDALVAGKSGIGRLDIPRVERLGIQVGARIVNLDLAGFTPSMLSQMDRVSRMAVVAAREALHNAGQPDAATDPERRGVFVGCGFGGATTMEEGYEAVFARGENRVRPLSVVLAMTNAPAAHVGMLAGAQGPCLTYANACASGAVAVGEALRSIRSGEIDVAVAGGTEALLTFGVLKSWEMLQVLALEDAENPAASCRPFSADRTGLVLGEGAAFVVLEEWDSATRRGAPILAELAGYACRNDATHLSKPDGAGQARAMRAALADANLAREEIGHVNAHGTATLVGDRVETEALRTTFGEHATRLAVSATKSMHGHLMGAAGAVEFVATVQALARRTVPPTMFLRQPDPQLGLDYVANEARAIPGLRAAMSNSFAFGGTNAVLVVRSAD
ncbi:MAG: beta-ketoacyl-[acyl-carrier-protein] synthase family protein [Betaproteobacteria bacterium]